MRHLTWSLLLTLAACAVFTTNPPHAADYNLTWTAPGDDGDVGTASAYDMRLAIDSSNLVAWLVPDSTTVWHVVGVKLPDTAGTKENHTLLGLTAGTTFFVALKARDEAFNWSEISNILRIDVPEDVQPAGIVDLRLDTP